MIGILPYRNASDARLMMTGDEIESGRKIAKNCQYWKRRISRDDR
jgi:hypothetical protein